MDSITILHEWKHEQDFDHVERFAKRFESNNTGAEDYPVPKSVREAMFGCNDKDAAHREEFGIEGTKWHAYERAVGSDPSESKYITICVRLNCNWTIDIQILGGTPTEPTRTLVISDVLYGRIGKPTGEYETITRGIFVNSEGEREKCMSYHARSWIVDLGMYPLWLRYDKLLNNKLVITFPATEITPFETMGIGFTPEQQEIHESYRQWRRVERRNKK